MSTKKKPSPEVVKKLNDAYEKAYPWLIERSKQTVPFVVGSDHQNPARITVFDMKGRTRGPICQRLIKPDGPSVVGHWLIDVVNDGNYEITLCHWPVVANKPINAKRARLKIQGFDESKSIQQDAASITFNASLKKGKTKLETWFMDGLKKRSAFYVYVERTK